MPKYMVDFHHIQMLAQWTPESTQANYKQVPPESIVLILHMDKTSVHHKKQGGINILALEDDWKGNTSAKSTGSDIHASYNYSSR